MLEYRGWGIPSSQHRPFGIFFVFLLILAAPGNRNYQDYVVGLVADQLGVARVVLAVRDGPFQRLKRLSRSKSKDGQKNEKREEEEQEEERKQAMHKRRNEKPGWPSLPPPLFHTHLVEHFEVFGAKLCLGILFWQAGGAVLQRREHCGRHVDVVAQQLQSVATIEFKKKKKPLLGSPGRC